MSPEQIQGGRGDGRSDIYAWGIIMYELLTGSVPFKGDNWMATMAGHLTRNPEPIERHRPDVPPELQAVVLKAMRRYPENRYQNADLLVADLDRLDHLDVSDFDLSPEPPLGGMAAIDSTKRLWRLVALVAVTFLAVSALAVALTVVL